MSPTPSLLLPAAPFLVSDVRHLQFFLSGRRRPRINSVGLGWEPVRTRMISSSFIGIRRTTRRSVICASLFGVGAPEALVIGVVALLVFGPKGLAEVARNLGKTLRAFQPTIRELQDVSREFRSTLEREIGIDEVPPSTNYKPTTYSQPPAADPNMKPETTPYTSEELMKQPQGGGGGGGQLKRKKTYYRKGGGGGNQQQRAPNPSGPWIDGPAVGSDGRLWCPWRRWTGMAWWPAAWFGSSRA
ncbi:hypothetical protein PR202_ga20511 [Eleusine coracana subsp. coracana]|uniref:Uncharacterized protein n=1 Tax=Eleusine coracana subsp. coracana TaxID=191504 RepID=A0AAV5CYV4_ELECO|nr:hypothetical protein PR202_ga20511 [Eleusine coracana subsp. coracana]